MAKEAQLHVDMAHTRQNEGINVIFDHNTPASARSRSRSIVSSSYSSADKKRVRKQRHYRSSSSSSSSSCSRPRSRSYPRCRRRSSRCRCADHHRYGRSYYRRSPSRYHSRSSSRSPSSDRSSYRRHHRSHRRSTSRSQSRSLTQWRRYRRSGNQYRHKDYSSRSHRSRSRSRSAGRSTSLTVQDEHIRVLNLELRESVKPILSESNESSPEPYTWVRVTPSPEKEALQSNVEESDDDSCLKLSPKRGIISFSINNSVAKPTLTAPTGAKVTSRVDTYEARKPYGHWIPVKSGRKRTSAKR
ncbi:arginine/serine-rich protein 1 [Gouania willdenowi]|uniref:arginine/serine-rich protein 1 n=1 Tax=Gouania willdenowi TaxID=441366 RepID=UPI0010550584|nr:arginine/serine-rich protein 1-like [Gouania willdenowi]